MLSVSLKGSYRTAKAGGVGAPRGRARAYKWIEQWESTFVLCFCSTAWFHSITISMLNLALISGNQVISKYTARMHAKSLQSCPTLCSLVGCSLPAPLSMGLSGQEYRSGLLSPPPGNLPDLGIELVSPMAPALQVDSLPLSHQGSPSKYSRGYLLGSTLSFS